MSSSNNQNNKRKILSVCNRFAISHPNLSKSHSQYQNSKKNNIPSNKLSCKSNLSIKKSFKVASNVNTSSENENLEKRVLSIKKNHSSNEYSQSLDNIKKGILVKFFNKLIKQNLENFNTIYLEGFGFLIPSSIPQVKIRDFDTYDFEISNVEMLNINFEKCIENTPYFREKYQAIDFQNILKSEVEKNKGSFKDISIEVIISFAKKFVNEIKKETIVNGVSHLLSIGKFYAIHNRQGETEKDWFAGANIIFVQSFDKVLFFNKAKHFKKPVYEDALEIFKVSYGEPVGIQYVNLKKELYLLGFSLEELRTIKDACLKLYIFEDRINSERGEIILHYVTDFLRQYGIKEYGVGTEFVFSLLVNEQDYMCMGKINIPKWPSRAFASAWLSLQNEELRKENTQVVNSFNIPLCEDIKKDFTGIFINDFINLPQKQEAKNGSFYYKNILAVTKDEVSFANRFSAKYVYDLLSYKNLNQVTRIKRRSIVEKTQRVRLAS